jgi:long-chain acyl-CoA synthetase
VTHPGVHALSTPGKAAVIMAQSGETISYAELDQRSIQLARLWQERGLGPGDHVAIFAENHPRYFEAFWAAMRSGLYFTTVNRYLTAEEAAYVVDDSGARSVVASHALADVAAQLPALAPRVELWLMWDGVVDGFESYEDAVAGQPAVPLEHQPRGAAMLYSSGTTGRPKGIRRPLDGSTIDQPDPGAALGALFGLSADAVYLSPAPLYHSAPLAFTNLTIAAGGTAVVMERFDPVEALRLIESHQVTHSQWVPTMFTRMLKLDAAQRRGWDLSSHRVAIHAAAPCPPEVKQQMIAWWGPILVEYYAGTEANGFCYIDSPTWLAHPGSVGQSLLGTIHICDEEGSELEAGEAGVIYFEREEMPFEYHHDAQKTRDAQHPDHPNWSTLGDMGYVDEDGFLFLTDRKDFMIISGGVNVYPREIEDVLIMHPDVADVAVFGVPHPEMGEEVKAVVQPAEGVEASPELERVLLDFAREHLAHYKAPRSVDFEAELPRLPTGKLYKRVLRDRYWAGRDTRI